MSAAGPPQGARPLGGEGREAHFGGDHTSAGPPSVGTPGARPLEGEGREAPSGGIALGDLAHGRDNNFQLLRLFAAAFVVLFHSYALTGRWTHEPLWKLAPELNFGALGVKIFFVISGFLVTQSWLARHAVRPFVAARVLRIYPALVAATLFTVVLAGVSSTLPAGAFVADPQTIDYAWRVALGFDMVYRLPGAFPANPFPHDVNGSLWTLPIELRLYVALLAAGVLGLLARRAAWLAVVAVLVAAFAVRPEWFPLAPNDRVVRELALLFGLGSLAWVWRDAVPVSLGGALAAVLLIAWNPGGLTRETLFAPLLAYVVLVLAYHPRLQVSAYRHAGDYSYGLYVYSFPLQQTLMQRLPGLEPTGLLALSLPLSLAVAALSWHLLEAPALALKSRFAETRDPP
ncbi:MAG: acyltransferase [Burkholderiales bacterium]